MEPLRVAVVMGGVSSEREISLKSGSAIAEALKVAGHQVTPVDITGENLADHLDPKSVDIVFIALHGRFGEDGKIQEQCERLGLAYTGSGPKASELALDKVKAKEIFVRHGLRTPVFEVITRDDANPEEILEDMGLPVVVKPPLEGSSIGLTIVREQAALAPAIGEAFRYGDSVLVEEFIEGREITAGILGDEALPLIQIVPKTGIYDYHSKYTPGQTEYLVPAPLDAQAAQAIQDAAMAAFDILGCEDFGRVDFVLAQDGKAYVLEVNTIPGFTQTSLLPKAAGAAGMGFEALCEHIMELGMRKVPLEIR